MTLVGAINPDFGQVEVDPAVVNLTAYETFFEEKRPFFTEGGQVFSALRAAAGPATTRTFFYSGAPALLLAPHRPRAPGPAPPATTWTRPPPPRSWARPSSPAARATAGRSACVEAVTGREYARLSDGLVRGDARGRAAHQLLRRARASASWDAAAAIGFLGTAVNRALGAPDLRRPARRARPTSAASTATCSSTRRRDWVVSGGLAGSTVSGQPGRHRSACRRAPSATTSGRTRPTSSVDPAGHVALGLERPRSASTRTAATSPSTPGCGASARASSPTTPASPPRPTAAARTACVHVAQAHARPLDAHAAGLGRRSGGPSTTAGSRRATACSRRPTSQLLNYWRLNLSLQTSWDTLDDKLTRGGPTDDPPRHREP